MPGWDYAGNGLYYITFVTQNRICNLGEIAMNPDGKAYIRLSDFGKIIETEFLKSFEIRQELFLDEYIIMPNHLHAIIVLRNPTDTPKNEDVPTNEGETIQTQANNIAQTVDDNIIPHDDDVLSDDGDIGVGGGGDGGVGDGVETHGRASLRASNNTTPVYPTNNKPNNFYRKPKSISSFIAGYKSVINTKIDDYIDEHNLDIPKYNRNNHFFQPNYYDHIIRNNEEYGRIKFYIKNNPQNWVNDKFNGR
jgi:REP element-mobilizing transposase RayT